MRVELLTPDVAPSPRSESKPDTFAMLVRDAGATLDAAANAEDAFSAGHGSLQDAVYERARADIAVSVAASAAQRAAQALQTITGMQL